MKEIHQLEEAIEDTLKNNLLKEFFESITQVIFLALSHDRFGVFRQKWDADHRAYCKEHDDLEERTKDELQNTFLKISEELSQRRSLHPAVYDRLSQIGVAIASENFQMRKGIVTVYFEISQLLQMLCSFGCVDIVYKYARIRDSVPMVSPFSGEWESKMISRCMFSPAYSMLCELERTSKDKKRIKPWFAWKQISYLAQCWRCRKDENLGIPFEHMQEIDDIRRGIIFASSPSEFFNRHDFELYLQILLEDIKLAPSKMLTPNELSVPYSIEWNIIPTLTYIFLVIDLMYVSSLLPHKKTTKVLHKCRNEFSVHCFLKKLLNSMEKQPVKLAKGSVIKQLERAGLNNIIGELFFSRPDGDKTHTIFMRKKSIKMAELTTHQVSEVMEYVSTLSDLHKTSFLS